MFVLCPHCQFLVAVDPRSGRPPATCPKCDGPMEAQAPEQQASEQAAQDVAGAPTETMATAHVEPPPPMAPAEWSVPTPLMPPAPEPPDALSEAIASIVVADAPPAQLSADAVIAAMAAKAPRKPRAKSSTDMAPARPARRKRAEATDAATPTPALAPAKKPERAAGPTIQQRIATWLAAMQPKPKAKPAATTPAVEAPKPVETPKRKASVKPIASLRDRAKAKAAETSVAPAAQPTAIETGAIDSNAIQSGTTEVVTTVLTLEPMAIEPVAVAPVMTEWTLEPIEVKPDTIDSVATEPTLALFEPDIGTIEPVPAEPLVIEHIVEDVIAPVVAAPLPASPVPGEEQHVAPRVADAPVAPVPSVVRVERPARPRVSSHAPSFARTRGGGLRAIASQGPVSSEWIRAGAVGVLALLLGLQLLLAQSETLAANARWRPTVNALCGVFRCTTPAWRQPEAFTMLSRDVRPHPRAAGTLQIDASFRNDARWSQAWPLLVVSLSDIDGRIVGTRAFSAHEYLGAEVTQNTLGPGQTAAISLAVVEPAPGIVAFSFDFR